MNKYKSNNNIVFCVNTTSYGVLNIEEKVLVGDVEKRLKEIINELALESKC